MEQREKQLQPVGICQKLFYFFAKAVAVQASKPVTLGGPARYKPQPLDIIEAYSRSPSFISTTSRSSINHDIDACVESKADDGTSSLHKSNGLKGVKTTQILKVRKKTVSIKDDVEVMGEKMQNEAESGSGTTEDGESKPLKSILRVALHIK